MRLIEKVIPAKSNHTATVIFFHGSGDSGNGLFEWIRFLLGRNLEIPHVKFIYPTAPVQRYTPMNGEYSNVWFDRREIAIEALECRKSLSSMYETVNEMLVRESEGSGLPLNRIVVGGFSMGGTISLHVGYHLHQNVAGVFALSTFLNNQSVVYDSLDNRASGTKLPPLKWFHGERDTLVPLAWGRKTFDELEKRGVLGSFNPLKGTLHELKKIELLELEKWLQEILPPLDNELQNKL